ncbi:hypothetical protein [Spiroplasma alleghenense]|uniref:Transmembrane protein n=1 Tax=Spiroplasma alleghenense TaxID=216931 RepID=A0A345Z2V5_9MOLU|nr:hypothetical protein [Spiroplasma alleghenense]AXK50934.1 hypothetical protein SALLE_v1c02580 [Spiroplasma alleghenense]
MLTKKKNKIILAVVLGIVLSSINITALIFIKSGLLLWTTIISTIIIFLLIAIMLELNQVKEEEFESKIKGKEFQRKICEILTVSLVAIICLNFMVFYSLWSLINSLISPSATIIFVILITWFVSNLLNSKISALISALIIFQPLINNINFYSLTAIGAVGGTIHITFFGKENIFEDEKINDRIINFKLRIITLSIVTAIILYGFFPFSKPGIYQDTLGFQSWKKIVNLLPVLLLLITSLFYTNYLICIPIYIFSQILISSLLGFAIQINAHNQLNFLALDNLVFSNTDYLPIFLNIIKTGFDLFIISFIGILLLMVSEKFNEISQKKFFNWIDQDDSQKPRLKTLNIFTYEMIFYGSKSSKYLYDSEKYSLKQCKRNMILESFELLLNSINPFGIVNLTSILWFYQNTQSAPNILVIHLLEFNWLVYIAFIFIITTDILGKYSDFLFNNWKFDVRRLKIHKKSGIEVK